jgi:hypothetical protein
LTRIKVSPRHHAKLVANAAELRSVAKRLVLLKVGTCEEKHGCGKDIGE